MVQGGSKPESLLAARRRSPTVVLTVGHSTRSQEDFIALLQAHAVKRLVDVRSIPRSRHNPQFNRDRIASALRRAGISYLHMKDLGGLRHPRSDSPNTAWRNASFRGFADYMQTRKFAGSLRKLMKMAKTKRTAIMCAEAVPWRCHRSLIGDALFGTWVPRRGDRILEADTTACLDSLGPRKGSRNYLSARARCRLLDFLRRNILCITLYRFLWLV